MKLGVIGISTQATREFISHSILNEFSVVTTPQIASRFPQTRLLQVTPETDSETQDILNVLSQSDAILFYAGNSLYTTNKTSTEKTKLIVTAMELCNLRRLVVCTGEQPQKQRPYPVSNLQKIFRRSPVGTQDAYSIISKSSLDWTVLTHHALTLDDIREPRTNVTPHASIAKATLSHLLSSASLRTTLALQPSAN